MDFAVVWIDSFECKSKACRADRVEGLHNGKEDFGWELLDEANGMIDCLVASRQHLYQSFALRK